MTNLQLEFGKPVDSLGALEVEPYAGRSSLKGRSDAGFGRISVRHPVECLAMSVI